MSLGISATGWLAIAAATTAAVTYNNGQQQAKLQKDAMGQAKANADRQATLAEQELNKNNQKRPNTAGILDAAQQAGKAGASGTMLTGASGVDLSALTLGKSTLLGG